MARSRKPIDLDAARKAIRKGQPLVLSDLDISVCTIHGRQFNFASDRVKDPIQRSHRKGQFYEQPELALIKAHFPQGGTFVDIGSNIGNHSLYVAAFLQPSRIIPFEPNPVAYRLLLSNVALNGFGHLFDLQFVGLGLSDSKATGFAMTPRDTNLGAARMQAGEGDIATVTGDEALAKVTPDFLKIDVEGMEMMVLNGLKETITRCTPTILIEVDQENYDAFDAWVVTMGYEVLDTFQRYSTNRNYLVRKQAESAVEAPKTQD